MAWHGDSQHYARWKKVSKSFMQLLIFPLHVLQINSNKFNVVTESNGKSFFDFNGMEFQLHVFVT